MTDTGPNAPEDGPVTASSTDSPADTETDADASSFFFKEAHVAGADATRNDTGPTRSGRSTRDAEHGADPDPDADLSDSPARSETSKNSDPHTGVLDPPQHSDPTEQGAFSIPNYAQDLIDFEFVIDAHDDYLPSGVDGEGMVVVGDGEFVAIAVVKPRSWSIHTSQKKTEIIQAYKSAFLATLDFPLQIVSYPTTFDISDHIDQLNDVMEGGRIRSTDSRLVNLGRQIYPDWFDRFIAQNDMKQRRFYIIIPLSTSQINQLQNQNAGLLDTAAEKFPPLAPLVNFFGDDTESNVTKRQCLRELDSRMNRVASGLHRLDVEVSRLKDRDAVMSVLYHYYNNEQPLNNAFPTGPYSIESEDAPIPDQLSTEQ